MIVFNCEDCGYSLTVDDDVETVKCRNCGHVTPVPRDDYDPMSDTLPELPGVDVATRELDA